MLVICAYFRLTLAFVKSLENDRRSLITLQERNANLEREVQRFKERKEIEQRVRFIYYSMNGVMTGFRLLF